VIERSVRSRERELGPPKLAVRHLVYIGVVSTASSSPWGKRSDVIYGVLFTEPGTWGDVRWLPKDFHLAGRGRDVR